MKHSSVLLVLCALAAFSAIAQAETTKQPNVILIMSDVTGLEKLTQLRDLRLSNNPDLGSLSSFLRDYR